MRRTIALALTLSGAIRIEGGVRLVAGEGTSLTFTTDDQRID